MKKRNLWISLTILSVTALTSCDDILSDIDNPSYTAIATDYNASAYVADTVYVASSNQPNTNSYLPVPPGMSDANFVDDQVQWEWGKAQRTTSRGSQTLSTLGRTPKVMAKQMARALDISTINKDDTPALWRLLLRSFRTGQQSATLSKNTFRRQRPYAMMGEGTPWYEGDKSDATGSYVSATTAAGWAVGLIFAEMWPPQQDDILKSAFQFGEDRVISGSNFQSDVNAGYVAGSAAIALAHLNVKLKQDIQDARSEYKKLKGLASSYNPVSGASNPKGTRIFNAPVTTSDKRYQADLKGYEYAKNYRNTTRGIQAIQDANSQTEHMAEIFGNTLGFTISETTTPAIYQLMANIRYKSVEITNVLRYAYWRARPYVQLGEKTPVPGDESSYRDNSSYPSGHASYAWALALALTEVAPEYQNKILKRAYDYGYNRVIVGYHWNTDVDAGRLVGCTVIARMHIDDDFCNQILQARAEYKKMVK